MCACVRNFVGVIVLSFEHECKSAYMHAYVCVYLCLCIFSHMGKRKIPGMVDWRSGNITDLSPG